MCNRDPRGSLVCLSSLLTLQCSLPKHKDQPQRLTLLELVPGQIQGFVGTAQQLLDKFPECFLYHN